VLGESAVVCDAIEGGWVEFGKGGMGVLAVQAFLEAIDPELLAGKEKGDREPTWFSS
jgi:hypothetical protein